jgi:hypothetical protein
MGSTSSRFLTINETATRLNVSRRTVHTYITKGFLRRNLRDGKVLLLKEEIEQLAVELGTDMPALTRKTFFNLTARVRRLEEQMAMAQAAWGAQEMKPMRPNTQEAVALYKAATDYLATKEWKFEAMSQWAELFGHFDEELLRRLAEANLTVQPWLVFYTLAARMSSYLGSTKEMKDDVRVQALRAKLEQGRKRIREMALFWIESKQGIVPAEVFKDFDTPKDDLLRSLGVKTGN